MTALFVLVCLAAVTGAGATPIDLRIHWIEPAWVPAASGGTVEVSGLGFDSTVTASVDGVLLPAASVQILNPTRLRLTLPAAPGGLPTISTLQLKRTLDPVNIQTATKTGSIFRPGSYTLSGGAIRPGVFYVRPAPGGNDANAGTSPTAPKATLNAAIDAAFGTNDSLPLLPAEIRAAAGTYSENVRVPRGAVLLGGWSDDFTQRDPDRLVSIIDGQRNNLSAVRTSGSTQNFCLLDSFTLTNSRRTGAGAAFRSYLGGPTLSHNVIIGNVASKRGAAIYFRFGETFDASATIAHNLIVGNKAQELSGGGVLLYAYYYTNQGDIDVAVTDNLIVGNRAILHGGGVAVGNSVYYTQDRMNVSLSHNRVQFNQAENGGALAVYPSFHTQFSIRAHDNLMGENSAQAQGGAVYFGGAGGGDLLVTSSTLVGNSAAAGGALYRAVPLRTSSQFTALTDDIIWSNTGGDIGDPENQVVIHYTLSNDDFSLRGAGNFTADPRFAPGPLGPFYLDLTSPAIDSGSDLASFRSLAERVTIVAQSPDAGRLDLGAHYPPIVLTTGGTPQLLHLVPAYGSFLGGDWVLLRGSSFDPGARVTFAGSDAARTLFVAQNRLLAEPPPRALQGAFTLVDVQIVNPGSVPSPQILSYRYVDADSPEWDSTLGVISADSPQESNPAIIVRWNPALDAVSPPIKYNVHREANTGTAAQLIIPQASNLIASGLSGTSYVDRAFVNRDVGSSFVYRLRALDSAFLPNEEMNLTRVFGTVLTGTNTPRPDPSIYLLSPREATSGDVVTLEALVSNQGSAVAASVGVDISLPAELVYVPGSTRRDGTIVVPDDTSGTPFPLDVPGITISDLPHSTSTRISFQVRISGAGGLLSWVGVVSSKSGPEVRDDNNRYERFINTKPLPGTDVSVVKTAPVSTPVGASILYTLRVANNGTLTAQNVIVKDTLPSLGLTYVNGSTRRDGGPVPDNSTGTPFPLDGNGLALGSFTGGDFTVLEFTGTLTAVTGSVVNEATVTTTTTDLNTANNTSQVTTRVALADLAVAAAAPAEALQGSISDLSVTVSNAGDTDALSVVLSDALPASLSYVAGSARRDGAALPDGATGTPFPLDEGGLALGSLAPGATTVVSFSVRALEGTGSATHSASASTTTTEATLANNSASASVALKFVDLALTKTAPATAVAGSVIDYTVRLTNAGSAPAPDTFLVDVLPVELSYVAGSTRRDAVVVSDDATGTPFPLDEAGFPLGSFAPAASTEITFSVTAPASPGTLTNAASASTSAPESNAANNAASATTLVRIPQADLALLKTAAPEPILGGGSTLRYTLLVRNDGDLAAENTQIADTLPAGVTFLTATPAPSSVSGNQIQFALGTLALPDGAPGGADEAVVSLDVRVDLLSGTLTNDATASTSTYEADLSDNSARAMTTVLAPPLADLAVSKSAPASVAVGQRFSYTIDISSTGTGPATSSTLLDTLPSGVTYVSGSTLRDGAAVPDDASGTPFPLDEGGLALGNLAVGASTRVQFEVRAPAQAGTVTNSASARTASLEVDLSDNQATAATQVTSRADLSLDKSGPLTVAKRGTITYTLAVRNEGPSPAASVVVTDTLPTGVTYFTGTTMLNGAAVQDATSGTAFPLDEGGLNIGSLNAGAAATITFQVRAPNADTIIVNQASDASATLDPNSGNNGDAVSTFVGSPTGRPDLTILMSDAPDPALSGTTLRYALTARNDGTLAAQSVNLADTLPSGVTFLSATPSPASVSGNLVQFALGTLAASNGAAGGADEATVMLDVRVEATFGTLTNSASVSTATAEATTANNTSSILTTVTEPAQADLALSKQAPQSAVSGSRITYTLSITNTGGEPAASVILRDSLPAGAAYVAGSTTLDGAAVPDGAGSTLFPLDEAGLDLGSMNAGGSTVVRFEATLTPTTGSVTNSASVTTSSTDTNPANNTASATTRVTVADLAVSTAAPAEALQGSTFEILIQVANAGEAQAESVALTDLLPDSLAYVAGSTRIAGAQVADDPSGTPFPLDEGGLNLGSLGPGTSTSVSFVARATSGSGAATHTASASTATPEAVLANNSASATTALLFVDLALAKSAPASAITGSTFEYSLRLDNLGSAAAPDTALSDTLPTGAAYIAGSTRHDGNAVPDAAAGTPFPLDEGGFALGSFPAGASTVITFSVSAPASPGTLANTAGATTSAPEPDTANNSAQATTRVVISDLAVSAAAPAEALQGSSFELSITVSNLGDADAASVTLSDLLSASLGYVTGSARRDGAALPDSATGTPFPLDEEGLALGTLAPGASTLVTFSVRALAGTGSATHTATASTTTIEATLANNTASASTVLRFVDLALVKSAPATTLSGSIIDYALRLTNSGSAPAPDAILTDALPAGLSYTPGSTRRDGTAVPDDTTGTPFPLDEAGLAVGSLAPAATTEITFRAAAPATPGTLINSASATGSAPEPDIANNTSQATTGVTISDLAVTATAPAEAVQSAIFELTTSVSNTGDAPADSVTLIDALPASLGYIAGSARRDGAAVPDAATGTPFPLDEGGLALGTLAPGATTLVSFSVRALDGSGSATHTAFVSTPTVEATLANNSASTTTVLKYVDLALVKSAPATAIASSTVDYSLRLANAGSAEAPDTRLNDVLPGGTVYLIGSTRRDGVAVPDDGTGTPFPLDETGLSLGSLPPAVTTEISFSVTAPASSGTLLNTGSASTSAPEPDTGNNTASATTLVSLPQADLALLKTAAPEPILGGGSTLRYTLVVRNDGDLAAENTQIIDTLPAGVTFLFATPAPSSVIGNQVQFALGTLALPDSAPGGADEAVITLDVRVDLISGTLANDAAASTSTYEENLSDNSARAVTTVLAPPLADLAVAKNAPADVAVGARFTYTIDVSSTGTGPATSSTLLDTLPAGVAYVAGTMLRDGAAVTDDTSGTPFSLDEGGLALGILPIGTTTRVRFEVRAPAQAGTVTNSTSAQTASLEVDLSDNQAASVTQVTSRADLSLDKSGPLTIARQGTVTYTLTVANGGPSAAASVVVTDLLPSGATYFAGTTRLNGTVVPDNTSGTPFPLDEGGLGIGSLTAGATATITFQVRAPNSNTVIVNQGSVSSATTDPNPGNGSDWVSTFVGSATSRPDLTVVMSDSPDPVLSGSTLRYTLTARNDGTAQAQSVTLTDTLPSGVTFLSATPAPASVSGNIVQFALGTLAASNGAAGGADEAAVMLDVRVDATSGTLTNSASVSTATAEATTANNASSLLTAVAELIGTDLTLVKQAPESAPAASRITYTLDARNMGGAPASDVVLRDTLPAGTTYVEGSTTRDGAAVPDGGSTPFPLDEAGLDLGILDAGSSTVVRFEVTLTATTGSVTNTASIATTTTDTNPANNTASATTRVTLADLAVSAMAPAEALEGSTFEISIQVANPGEAAAESVSLTDTLPASLAYVAGTTRLAGAVVADDPAGTPFPLDEEGLALGSLAPGATTVVSFSARALEGTGSATHTASASTPTPETTLANNSASATTALLFVDLSLTKTAPASVLTGATFDYSLRLENLGSAAAPDTILSDTLPPAATYVAGTTLRDGVAVPDNATGTPFPLDEGGLTLGSLPAGGVTALTFSAVAPSDAGALINTASAATSAPQSSSANDSASATTLLTLPGADVRVSKSALAGAVSGKTLTYTIDASVAGGGAAARSVVCADTLPAGTSYVVGSTKRDGAAVPDGISGTPFPLDEGGLNLGDMGPGALTRLTFAVRIDLESGTLVNDASVSSLSSDPDTFNNTAQATTAVTPAGGALTPVGNTLRWDASGAALNWSTAAGDAVYFVHRADTGSAYATGTSTRVTPLGVTGGSWPVPDMPAAGRVLFYRVNAGDGEAETDELHMADLTVAKSAPASVFEGSQVTYTIAVRNVGAREASSATLTDTLPAEATYVAGTTRRDGQPVADSAAGTPFPLDEAGLEIGPRPGGTLTTVTFEARLDGAGATAVNQASVSTATPEHTASNNASQAGTAIGARPRADLHLTKTDGPDPITGGGSRLFYYLSLRNDGDLAAENVEIVDTLPAGVTFLGASQPPVEISGQTLRFALGTLAASDGFAGGNDEAVVNIEVRVDLLSGTLTNQATASTSSYEPNLANNTAQTTTTVQEPPLADLVVTKSAPAIVTPGQRFTYVISVSNTGTAFANSTRLLDTLPAGVSYIPGTTTVDTVLAGDDPLGTPFPLDESGLDTGTIGTAFPRVVRFDVVAPTEVGTISNIASVSTSTPEPDLSDNQATAVTQVQGLADLTLDKSGPVTAAKREIITYTLAVTNRGPAAASSVVVGDTLPAGASYTAASTLLNGVAVPDAATGTPFPLDEGGLNIGSLAAGATATITFQARMPNATVTVINRASVAAQETDPNTTDNSDSVTTFVGGPTAQADLALTKSDSADPVTGGGTTLRYTLLVRNDGTLSASAVTLTDTLPSGVTFLSATPAPSSITGSSVQFALGALAASDGATGGVDERTVTIDVRVVMLSGSLLNQASVTTTSSEANPANNTAQAYTTVEAPAGGADLSVAKQAPASVVAGDTFVYTLTVSNAGSLEAQAVSLVDTLPAGAAYAPGSTTRDGAAVPDSASGTPFPLDGAGLDLGSFTAGTSTVVRFSVTAPSASGTLTNSASVSSPTPDPDPSDNTGVATTNVTIPDLVVTASAPAEALQGATFDLSLGFSNAGDGAARSVVASDTLPASLAYVPGSAQVNGAGVPDGATGTPFPLDEGGLGLGDLAAGAGATVSFSVRAVSGSGTATHTASAATPTPESSLVNNSASASTTLRFVDLSLAKSGPANALSGSALAYSLQLINLGSAPAPGAVLSDTLPVGVTYVAGSTRRDGILVPDAAAGTPFPLDEGGLGLGDLAAGAATTITFSATAPDAAGALTNSASATTTAPESRSDNNSATAVTQVALARADLALNKGDAPDPITGGGTTLRYTLTVRNDGNVSAASVSLTDTLPSGVTFLTATPAPASINGATLTFALGSLAASDGALGGADETQVTIDVSVDLLSGTLTNQASVSTSTPEDDLADNSAQAVTTVQAAAVADLAIDKSGPATAGTRTFITYTLTVTNAGPGMAISAVMVDTLPLELEYRAGNTKLNGAEVPDDSSGTPSPLDEGGLNIGNLGAGATATITFQARTSGTPGTVINSAIVSSQTPDSNSANNSDSASTTIQ